jgi:hypothetical protein
VVRGSGDKAVAVAAIDLLLNLLMVFVVISAISITRMNRPAQDKAVELKAEVIIEMTWPENNFDDLDLWLLLPNGEKVGFDRKDVGVATLDRDDRGGFGDTFEGQHGEINVIRINKEVTAIRANRPGRYVVNVHYYHDFTEADIGALETNRSPSPVLVKLTKLNPRVLELANRSLALGKVGSQQTAFCFEMDTAGTISKIDHACNVPFVRTLDGAPRPGA